MLILQQINHNYYNNNHNNYDYSDLRFLACDGTILYFNKCLEIYKFKLSNNNNCCKSIANGLYDIDKKCIVSLDLNKNNSEREEFKRQINSLNNNDVIIFDRGYYSLNLLCKLHEYNVGFIFRLKGNLKIVTNLLTNDEIINIKYNNKNIKMRIIKYKINNKNYYIGTSILDNAYDINFFKTKYNDR
jgi:hypothetical protein